MKSFNPKCFVDVASKRAHRAQWAGLKQTNNSQHCSANAIIMIFSRPFKGNSFYILNAHSVRLREHQSVAKMPFNFLGTIIFRELFYAWLNEWIPRWKCCAKQKWKKKKNAEFQFEMCEELERNMRRRGKQIEKKWRKNLLEKWKKRRSNFRRKTCIRAMLFRCIYWKINI